MVISWELRDPSGYKQTLENVTRGILKDETLRH